LAAPEPSDVANYRHHRPDREHPADREETPLRVDDVFFGATGITDGYLLKGVKYLRTAR
jgi:hypothetical protein